MGTSTKVKGLLLATFVAASLFVGGPAEAAKSGTWAPDSGLDGFSPGQFADACRTVYGGTPTFEGGVWTCTLPGGGVIACDQGSGVRATHCRKYTPAAFLSTGGRPGLAAGPTQYVR
jgi:hypothetical protein